MTLALTVTGVRGHQMIVEYLPGYRPPIVVIDRDVLAVPEIVVDDLSRAAHVLLRPVLDMLWNAGGWPRSPHYDKDGLLTLVR
jgi:hypothetical protein